MPNLCFHAFCPKSIACFIADYRIIVIKGFTLLSSYNVTLIQVILKPLQQKHSNKISW